MKMSHAINEVMLNLSSSPSSGVPRTIKLGDPIDGGGPGKTPRDNTNRRVSKPNIVKRTVVPPPGKANEA